MSLTDLLRRVRRRAQRALDAVPGAMLDELHSRHVDELAAHAETRKLLDATRTQLRDLEARLAIVEADLRNDRAAGAEHLLALGRLAGKVPLVGESWIERQVRKVATREGLVDAAAELEEQPIAQPATATGQEN